MTDKTDLTRRKILTGMGILAAGELLSHATDSKAADNSTGLTSHPSWDKPFSGEIPKKLPEGYNILFVVTDQERYFPQYPFPAPGRERLMKTGTTFCLHQSNSNICTSARSVLYTGLHMPQTKMFDNAGLPWMPYSLDPKLRTIGHMMRDLGYYSAYKGKWHLTNEFEVPIPGVADIDTNIGEIPTVQFHHTMEEYGFSDYYGVGDIIGHNKGGYFYDGITTAQTISWLRRKGQLMTQEGKPWFLAVNLVNPHDIMFIDTDQKGNKVQWRGQSDKNNNSLFPSQPPDADLYLDSWPDYPLPENRHQSFKEPGRPAAHYEFQTARASLEGMIPNEDRRWRKLLDYYFNCIRDCDAHLVRVLQELDDLKLTEKTIVVFTADHGELGGAHQMHGKGASVYKEQIHVPMIISHPAYPGGKRCNTLTSHLDIVPTLVALTGLPAQSQKKVLDNRKGHDFSPLLQSPEQATVHSVREATLYCYGMILYTDAKYLWQVKKLQADTTKTQQEIQQEISKLRPDFRHRSGTRMINDGEYKFARYFSLREHNKPESWEELLDYNDIELYDLKNDPNENHNLAANKEKHKDLILRMNAKLNEIIKKEIGIDDGKFMPDADKIPWNLTVEQFNQIARD